MVVWREHLYISQVCRRHADCFITPFPPPPALYSRDWSRFAGGRCKGNPCAHYHGRKVQTLPRLNTARAKESIKLIFLGLFTRIIANNMEGSSKCSNDRFPFIASLLRKRVLAVWKVFPNFCFLITIACFHSTLRSWISLKFATPDARIYCVCRR